MKILIGKSDDIQIRANSHNNVYQNIEYESNSESLILEVPNERYFRYFRYLKDSEKGLILILDNEIDTRIKGLEDLGYKIFQVMFEFD